MSLIVKIMGAENAPDDDPRKTFQLHTGVIATAFLRHSENEPDAPASVVLTFEPRAPVNEPTTGTFPVHGNVYVMNEAGKTIASFGAAPIPTQLDLIRPWFNGVITDKLDDYLDSPIDARHLYNMLSVDPGCKLIAVHEGDACEIGYVEGTTFVMKGMHFYAVDPGNQLQPGAPLAPGLSPGVPLPPAEGPALTGASGGPLTQA